MTITAKFPGTCPTCGSPIHAGEKVEWAKGEKARHTSCPTAQTPAATPARPSNLATDKQVSALRRMLSRLQDVGMFDSVGGDGFGAAQQIRAEIRKLGGEKGAEGLTRTQVSQLLDQVSALLDDEM